MSDNVRMHRRSKRGVDPKMIGLWKIGRTLGSGASGRVRMARHSKTGQYAAVKIISKGVLNSHMSLGHADEEAQKVLHAIEREIVIMKLIDHPNIMRLYDVWETSTELYLILEYIEGGELFDYLCNRGKLSTSEALGYFQQIMVAVDYCHHFNIAHRDLKPENLLLDKDNNIKVADFGMAAWQGKTNLLQTACGSPHYAAPEVVMGRAYNGACSDIWSCGIVLYALLAGKLPFDDDDMGVLLDKVKIGKFMMPTHLDPSAKDLISKMLEKNPTKRITVSEVLKHPFFLSVPPKVTSCDAPNLDDIARPITDSADLDADILANLKTLWPGTSEARLKEALTNEQQTWEKGIYHLLMQYRARRLENYDEEEETLAERRRQKRAKKKNQRVRIAEDLPLRTGPPTPRRASRYADIEGLPAPDSERNTFRQLTAVGSEEFAPEATSSARVGSDSTSPFSPQLENSALGDERIQTFFQQIVEHLNVMQTSGEQHQKRAVADATASPAVTRPPPPTPLQLNLGTPFTVRTGVGNHIAGADTFADMKNNDTGTRPLSIRRRNTGKDKENAAAGQNPSYLTADHQWPERRSSLRSNGSTNSKHTDRHVHIVEPERDRAKLRKKSSVARSRSPSSSGGSSADGGGSHVFSSTPKRSWFGAVFRFGPAAYQLLSTQDVAETRRECRQILENMGVSVMLTQTEGMGIFKCRLEETRDPAGVMATVKPAKFRIELRIPTTVQAVSGYTVLLDMVMEKGAHSSFKLVYGRLRREWVLDTAPIAFAMEGRADDDDRFVEVVYAS